MDVTCARGRARGAPIVGRLHGRTCGARARTHPIAPASPPDIRIDADARVRHAVRRVPSAIFQGLVISAVGGASPGALQHKRCAQQHASTRISACRRGRARERADDARRGDAPVCPRPGLAVCLRRDRVRCAAAACPCRGACLRGRACCRRGLLRASRCRARSSVSWGGLPVVMVGIPAARIAHAGRSERASGRACARRRPGARFARSTG